MKKKIIGIIVVIVIASILIIATYNQITPKKYEPTDFEIALHLQLDTKEDIGLLVYDYRIDSRKYSGDVSNADGSLIKHNSDIIVVLNKKELNNIAGTFELSMQLRIITEHTTPNYENIYPDNITKYIEPISWKVSFGKAYFITITGDKISGYKANIAG